jgi:hypothetical protein
MAHRSGKTGVERVVRRYAAPAWLNKGVFISVAGRQATGVIYETYLVG